MAAPTSIEIIGRHNLGDRWMVSAIITGGTLVTAVSLGMIRIDCGWFQDIDDDPTTAIPLSTYAGSQVAFTEITAGSEQVLNVIGF
jgi:hypothetical protein